MFSTVEDTISTMEDILYCLGYNLHYGKCSVPLRILFSIYNGQIPQYCGEYSLLLEEPSVLKNLKIYFFQLIGMVLALCLFFSIDNY